MLHIYICPNCYNLRMVSRKTDAVCFHCGEALVKCDVNYDTYMNMSEEDRVHMKSEYKNRISRYQQGITNAIRNKRYNC